MTFLIKILENIRNGKLRRHDSISDFMRFLSFEPFTKPDFIGFLAFRYVPTISNEIVQNRSNGHNSKSVDGQPSVGSNPTHSAILRGFCQVQEPRFSLGTHQKSLGTHKFTTPARVLSDENFEFASKWEYVFAVVEKSLCPSHT